MINIQYGIEMACNSSMFITCNEKLKHGEIMVYIFVIHIDWLK